MSKPNHEHGIFSVADVQPLDVDGVRTLEVGTALWAVAFVALLPFYASLQESGRLWWLWTCTAGLAFGLFGLEYCRRRRDRLQEERSAAPAPARAAPAPPAPQRPAPPAARPTPAPGRAPTSRGGRRRAH